MTKDHILTSAPNPLAHKPDRSEQRPRPPATVRRILILAVLASGGPLAGCNKVPPPDQVFTDTKADQAHNLCLAWQHGNPRQILTDAAHGGADRRVLARFLLREWREDDPEDLRQAFGTLKDSAAKLDTTDPDTVLAEAEPALEATDRYFDAHCPPIIAADTATTTGPRHPPG